MESTENTSKADIAVNRAQQLIQTMRPITLRAESISIKVQRIAWLYLLGAVVLTACLFLPFSSQSGLLYASSVVVLLLLSVPSIILFVFHAGLNSIIALPIRLLEKAGIGEASARSMLSAVTNSELGDTEAIQGKILRTLSQLKKQVLESKEMLLEYSVILRFTNPFVLTIVAISTLTGFGILLVAVIAIVIVSI